MRVVRGSIDRTSRRVRQRERRRHCYRGGQSGVSSRLYLVTRLLQFYAPPAKNAPSCAPRDTINRVALLPYLPGSLVVAIPSGRPPPRSFLGAESSLDRVEEGGPGHRAAVVARVLRVARQVRSLAAEIWHALGAYPGLMSKPEAVMLRFRVIAAHLLLSPSPSGDPLVLRPHRAPASPEDGLQGGITRVRGCGTSMTDAASHELSEVEES
jgi:hypothetical protein